MVAAMATGYEHPSEDELLDSLACGKYDADGIARMPELLGNSESRMPSRWARSSMTPTSRQPSSGPSRPAASAIHDPLPGSGPGEERHRMSRGTRKRLRPLTVATSCGSHRQFPAGCHFRDPRPGPLGSVVEGHLWNTSCGSSGNLSADPGDSLSCSAAAALVGTAGLP